MKIRKRDHLVLGHFSSVTLDSTMADKKSTLNGLNHLKSPEIGLFFKTTDIHRLTRIKNEECRALAGFREMDLALGDLSMVI
jgi:hypothetical protein